MEGLETRLDCVPLVVGLGLRSLLVKILSVVHSNSLDLYSSISHHLLSLFCNIWFPGTSIFLKVHEDIQLLEETQK